jgi:hypothetical protein
MRAARLLVVFVALALVALLTPREAEALWPRLIVVVPGQGSPSFLDTEAVRTIWESSEHVDVRPVMLTGDVVEVAVLWSPDWEDWSRDDLVAWLNSPIGERQLGGMWMADGEPIYLEAPGLDGTRVDRLLLGPEACDLLRAPLFDKDEPTASLILSTAVLASVLAAAGLIRWWAVRERS